MAAGVKKVGFAVKLQLHSWSVKLTDDASTYRWWGGHCWWWWVSGCHCLQTSNSGPAWWSPPTRAGTAATGKMVSCKWCGNCETLKCRKSIDGCNMIDRADCAQLRYNLHCPRLGYQHKLSVWVEHWTNKISSRVSRRNHPSINHWWQLSVADIPLLQVEIIPRAARRGVVVLHCKDLHWVDVHCEDLHWEDLHWEDLHCEDLHWDDVHLEGCAEVLQGLHLHFGTNHIFNTFTESRMLHLLLLLHVLNA